MSEKEVMIFDQYSRYYGVASILQGSSIEFSSVLDIGSGPYCLLGRFLGGKDITYLDPLLKEVDSSGKKTISDSIFDLDADSPEYSRDVVVSIDTYEHIPPDKRMEFVDRCSACAKKAMLFAFPCVDTPEARQVDQEVHLQYQSVYNMKYSWLSEHDEYGLPSSNDLVKRLESEGWSVRVFRHGRVDWLKELLPKIILLHEFPEMRAVIDRTSEFFNRNFAKNDWASDGYRTIVVAARDTLSIDAHTGMPDRTVEEREWKQFMNMFYSELVIELRTLLGDGRDRIASQEQKVKDVVVRDAEIHRLSQVVSQSSATIEKMYQDLLSRDAEIGRLNKVVESSSEDIMKLSRDLEIRDNEIIRLQKIISSEGG
jgi:O-antigen biosynthesis protein